jgi:hypothetical protein
MSRGASRTSSPELRWQAAPRPSLDGLHAQPGELGTRTPEHAAGPVAGSAPTLLGFDDAEIEGVKATLSMVLVCGDTAVEVVHTLYKDSSKTTPVGQRVYSWAVEADTGITAIVNFITRDFDSKNLLVLTQQARFRIDASGKLDMVTFDVQSVAAKPGHWLYTAL